MSEPLTVVYFPLAVGLGALHALEPGHAKTMIAAYLIGVKGTKWDAILLGLTAATTHSLVVIAIAMLGVLGGKRVLADDAGRWLERGSGILVIAIGAWMLWRRWPRRRVHVHEHHAPDAVTIDARAAQGRLSIIWTPAGERMVFAATRIAPEIAVRIEIERPGTSREILPLRTTPEIANEFVSESAPAEPHEFTAYCIFTGPSHDERIAFAMHEPHGHDHGHDHAHLDEDAHARAHAATMPAYVRDGARPTLAQIVAFGAAGGMIPCPASITVMLLAVSIGRAALGLLAVLCFSFGLATTLVGIGLLVVISVGRVHRSGRFAELSRHAPLLSSVAVIASGIYAVVLVR